MCVTVLIEASNSTLEITQNININGCRKPFSAHYIYLLCFRISKLFDFAKTSHTKVYIYDRQKEDEEHDRETSE